MSSRNNNNLRINAGDLNDADRGGSASPDKQSGGVMRDGNPVLKDEDTPGIRSEAGTPGLKAKNKKQNKKKTLKSEQPEDDDYESIDEEEFKSYETNPRFLRRERTRDYDRIRLKQQMKEIKKVALILDFKICHVLWTGTRNLPKVQ